MNVVFLSMTQKQIAASIKIHAPTPDEIAVITVVILLSGLDGSSSTDSVGSEVSA